MLAQITPILLTHNEAPNIGRTLSHLIWAKDIVVVDSGSSDETLSIVRRFPQVRIFERPFDSHSEQWRFAVTQTNVGTSWILRLDADYQLSDHLIREISELDPNASVNGYRIAFDYAIFSRKLRASLYPPNTVLLRMGCFSIWQNGHTEAWTVEGPIGALKSRIVHDDWKQVERWTLAQTRYMRREMNDVPGRRRSLQKLLRLMPPLMPLVVFLYCLFGKGLILNGRAGMFYALQRLVAESILSLMILERRLQPEQGSEQASTKDGNDRAHG